MSAPAPATRRSGSSSRRFDYCRFIELDYVPMESGYMVSMRPTKNHQPSSRNHQPSSRSPTKGISERHASAPSTPRSRRTAPPSSREPHGNPSLCSSSSGSCKGSDCSPTKGRQKLKSCTENHGIRPPPPEQYLTPLQQKEVCIRHLRSKLKETIDTLQNRDCEIDELRERLFRMQEDWVEEECHRVEAQLALKEARAEIQALKQAVEGVRARLSDTGDFQDINSQNHRLESLLLNMEVAQGLVRDAEERAGFRARLGGSAPASVSGESPGAVVPRTVPGARVGSCSCEGSPARSITRSSTYTKLTEQALADKSGHEFSSVSAEGTQDSGFVCESGVPSRADLLLEAAYLSEETASLLSAYTQTFAALPNTVPNAVSNALPHPLPHALPHPYSQTLPHSFPRHPGHAPPHVLPHSSTFEGVCAAEHLAPFRCGLSSLPCLSHPCLSHHLYLHPLREAGIQTESCPIPAAGGCPSDLDTIAEARTFRSQACSPTSTWASDDGEELDSTTSLTTATVMSAATEPVRRAALSPSHALPRSATVGGSIEGPLCSEEEQESKQREEQESERREEQESERREEQESERRGEQDSKWREEQESERREEQESERREKDAADLETSIKSEGSQSEATRSEKTKSEVTLSNGKCKTEPHAEETPTATAAGKEQVGHSETPSLIVCAEGKPGVCAEGKPGVCTEGKPGGEDLDLTTCTELEDLSCPALSPDEPQTSQPKRCPSPERAAGTDGAQDTGDAAGPVQKSYWSRHFLVDLLAVAIPVVPTVAWLCRGPVRDGQPMYHIGSLLRGCCTVALHSLRRSGGLRHYPAGGGAHI